MLDWLRHNAPVALHAALVVPRNAFVDYNDRMVFQRELTLHTRSGGEMHGLTNARFFRTPSRAGEPPILLGVVCGRLSVGKDFLKHLHSAGRCGHVSDLSCGLSMRRWP